MTTIVQCDPWIKVDTDLGPGFAIFYESDADEIYWTVALKESRAIVQFPNNKIRIGRSFTLGFGLGIDDMRKLISRGLDK